MRALLLGLGTLLLCGGCLGSATAGPADVAPVIEDPDLKIGASCSGTLKAAKRAAMLPTEIRETVVVFPRAGKRTVDGVCQSVTRFTLVNHTGQIVTISFVEIPQDAPMPQDGWEVLDGPSRARFTASQDSLGAPGDPPGKRWFLESESAPTTSQETLESILGFFDPAAVGRAVLTGERAEPPE